MKFLYRNTLDYFENLRYNTFRVIYDTIHSELVIN